MVQTPQPLPPEGPPAVLTIDYPVFFDQASAQAKLQAAQRNRNGRLFSLAVSLAVTGAIYWFLRDQLDGFLWPLLALSVALPVAYLGWAVGSELVFRGEAERVPPGLALGVARSGLALPDGWLSWAEVGAIRAVSRSFGRSADLVVQIRDGRTVRLPLDHLTAAPAAIDGAVKALSGGRARVDFGGLDA